MYFIKTLTLVKEFRPHVNNHNVINYPCYKDGEMCADFGNLNTFKMKKSIIVK